MDLGARIGWGIVIYAVVFLVWTGTGIYGFTQGVEPYIAELLALIIVCLWAGSELKFRTWKDIFPYSFGWAVIAVALDALYVVPLQGWGWYEQWATWISYALIALLPLLSVYLRKKTSSHGPWES
jgi:hypothetical protein